MIVVTPSLKDFIKSIGVPDGLSEEDISEGTIRAIKAGSLTTKQILDWISKDVSNPAMRDVALSETRDFLAKQSLLTTPAAQPAAQPAPKESKAMTVAAPTMQEITNSAGAGGAGAGIRVKRASERYRKDTAPVISKATGQPLVVFGSVMHSPSEQSYARIGAWFKHFLARNPQALMNRSMQVPVLNEHERDLLAELYHEKHFCGTLPGGIDVDCATLEECKLSAKAILDDSTSGAQTLVPYELDQAVVRIPYLHSQIMPLVDLKTCSSSEVRTSKMGQVTVSWGPAEGTAASLFDTDSLFSEQAIPINPCVAAVEFGRDLEADTPVADFGQLISDEFGQAMLASIEKQLIDGNGTTEPEGLLTASGTVSANSDNAASGPWTMADYIELPFSIGLAYREQSLNPAYISSDTVYQRSRSIKIDTASPSTDQRPVFGMDIMAYNTFGYPHLINNTGLTNRHLLFCCLKKYRLYRRTGIETFFADNDFNLMRQNLKGMCIRSRWGGKLVDGNACAIIADGQS